MANQSRSGSSTSDTRDTKLVRYHFKLKIEKLDRLPFPHPPSGEGHMTFGPSEEVSGLM